MRIRITPDRNYNFAFRMKAAAVELNSMRRVIILASRRLDWVISGQSAIDSLIHQAISSSDRLAEEANRLSEYLKLTGTRFQDVDSQFIFKAQPLSAPGSSSVFSLKSSMNPYSAVQLMPAPQTKSLGWIKGVII